MNRWRHSNSYSHPILGVVFIAAGFFLPWWAICLPALAIGLAFGSKRHRISHLTRNTALIGALSWLLVAMVWDARTLGHLSGRLSGIIGSNYGVVIYFVIGTIAAVLAGLSCQLGLRLRDQLSKKSFLKN